MKHAHLSEQTRHSQLVLKGIVRRDRCQILGIAVAGWDVTLYYNNYNEKKSN